MLPETLFLPDRYIYRRREVFPDVLPQFSLSRITPIKRQQMLITSIATWNSNFQLDDFLTHLSYPESLQQKAYLKHLRKYGNILRSTFLLAGMNELPTETLNFIRQLGKFNDNYEVVDLSAKQRLQHFATTAASTLLTDTPNTNEVFIENIKTSLQRVNNVNSQTTIEFEPYHDMRKKLRDLLNLILLDDVLEGKEDNPLYDFGYKLLKQMGELKDTHDIAIPTVIVPADMQQEIKTFTAAFVD